MIDTTTGMSPPPMAMTRCQPRNRARAVMTPRAIHATEPSPTMMNATISATEMTRIARLSRLRAGSSTGAPLIFSASFSPATTEPEKVTAPMNVPRNTSPRWKACALPVRPPSSMKELKQMNTAARPTKPL